MENIVELVGEVLEGGVCPVGITEILVLAGTTAVVGAATIGWCVGKVTIETLGYIFIQKHFSF